MINYVKLRRWTNCMGDWLVWILLYFFDGIILIKFGNEKMHRLTADGVKCEGWWNARLTWTGARGSDFWRGKDAFSGTGFGMRERVGGEGARGGTECWRRKRQGRMGSSCIWLDLVVRHLPNGPFSLKCIFLSPSSLLLFLLLHQLILSVADFRYLISVLGFSGGLKNARYCPDCDCRGFRSFWSFFSTGFFFFFLLKSSSALCFLILNFFLFFVVMKLGLGKV